jgi:hypothetical protein
MKKQLMLLLLFLSPMVVSAQKTTLSYNVVVYVEQKTADYFGGKQAMQDSVNAQLAKVSANFNAQASLTNNYSFTAVSFKFYNDNANDDSTFAYHQKPPEANNQYRLVYNAFPRKLDANGNYVNAYTIVFEIGYQSVLFSYRESVSSNGSMFGRVMTNTVTHEFTHSRGAWDLYAGDIDASQNLVKNTLGWKNPTPSLMNSLFTSTVLDEHSVYMVNKTASLYGAATFTDGQRGTLTGAAFPNTISISALNSSGTAQSGAVVKLYGITWYQGGSPLSATPTYTYTTDVNGKVNMIGAANNPFNVSGGMPQYNTFFVSVSYAGVTKYGWIPCYEVSKAFILGQTSYTKTISLGSANISPSVSIGNSGNLINYNTTDFSIPVFAYDLDGSIASVKLYDNGAYFADATFDGSNIYWFLHYPNLSVGKHLFTAIATDNSGATTTSGTLQVNDLPLYVINTAITAPASGTSFTAPASVPFTAYAVEGGGTISKVEYYNGATLIGTTTAKPYAFTWTNVAAGTYTLTAKAYDGQGTPITKTSAVITVTVKTVLSPTVAITSPANNAVFTAPASITLNASASETGGTISKVEFYRGSTLLGTSTTSPYTYTWTGAAAGTYSLTAKAYDGQAVPVTKTSTAVSITVNAALSPIVSITSPANNASFAAPASMTITASASETGGTISKVEFYRGNTLLGTSTTSPYTYTWTGIAAGTYSLTAKAYDGQTSPVTKTSTAISITVTNGGTCTTPVWNAATAYTGGALVSYLGIRYQANWWTQGNPPNTNSGPAGSGQPWLGLGACNSRIAEVALKEFVATVELSLYPNPTDGAKEIVLSYLSGITEVGIVNFFGQQVLSGKYEAEKTIAVSIESLNTGIYMVNVHTMEGVKVLKFIKD